MRRGRGVRALSRGRFICCSNKISLEPGKEPEETHALLHGASFLFLVFIDIDWNESEKLFRVNGNLNRRPEFYNLL